MRTRDKSGTALMLALIFMMICALISATFVMYTLNARSWSQRDLNREQAFSLAESAVELAAENLVTNPTIPSINAQVNVSGVSLGAGSYSYSIRSLTNMYQYSIHGTATVGTVKRAVHVARAEKPTFAAFALWMNINNVIYFFGGEVFNGPVFSNDYLYFQPTGSAGATFHDFVGSAKSTAGSGSVMTGTTFDKGIQYNAASQSMASVQFTNLLATAQANGLVLTGRTIVKLNGTNAVITNTKKGWTNFNYGITNESIVYVTDTSSTGVVQIAGKLDGRLTIVADGSFQITNHILYASDPRTNSASDDALGLIAGGNITVMTNAPDGETIFAAMMATGLKTTPGSFSAQNYNTRPPSGNLTVWGSIVQNNRGAVNTGGGGTSGTGFAKNYGFDTRFSTVAPPYYPRLSSKIVIFGWWDESVQ